MNESVWEEEKKKRKKKKRRNKIWPDFLNQLSPVGKVGNVMLWDSFSVSISCLHVHLILNQTNPAVPIQYPLPHLVPTLWFGSNAAKLKVNTGMSSWAFAPHRKSHAHLQMVHYVAWKLVLNLHLLLIQCWKWI